MYKTELDICEWLRLVHHFKATLVFILALLRPHDMPQHNRADHHEADKDVHEDQWEDHHAAHNQDRFTGKGIANGKGSRDQGRVGEDEGKPRHAEGYPARADGRYVSEAGDEEEKDGQPGSLALQYWGYGYNERNLPPQP